MANLGFQAVYGILARAGIHVERAFLPDRRPYADVRSLEGGRPIADFDVVAFSISFETDYVHVLDVLAAAGIPLRSDARDDRTPLVIAGGPATFLNPEPIADFVDLFLLGEAEEMLPEWIEALRALPSRSAMLDASSAVHGSYSQRTRLSHRMSDPDRTASSGLPRPPRRRPDVPVLDARGGLRNMFLLEASRGCGGAVASAPPGSCTSRPPPGTESLATTSSRRRSTLQDGRPRRRRDGEPPGVAALSRDRGAGRTVVTQGGPREPPRRRLAPALHSVTIAPEAGSERVPA
jgi:radical SAM superfamily enzyme YgiQ (UPF0313 family)